jgi:hypothetical protein
MQELISRDEMAGMARWCELVEQLATDAEALQVPEPGRDDRAYREEWQALSDRWMATCWTALTPPFIAASARLARAKVCPQPLQLREEGPPEGFRLIPEAELEQWLVVKTQRARIAEGRAQGKWQRKRSTEMESDKPATDEEAAAAERRAAYAAKKQAEAEEAKQDAADREARMLAVAAEASAPAPEPAPDPADAVPEEAPATAAAPVVWVTSPELAEALGLTQSAIDNHRRAGRLEGLWRLPGPDRVRGTLFDLEGCKAVIRDWETAPRKRKRRSPAADAPADPLPVVIQEIETQVPPVEPAAPMTGATDAAALLALAEADPAVLAALRELLQGGS